MDDARLWGSEKSLWTTDHKGYQAVISDEALMVLPGHPGVLSGQAAVEAVSATPRWTEVTFTAQHASRPQEGLIVIAYAVEATKDHECYSARCTTTYLRLSHEEWRVIQHQQSILDA
mgnify:CR=1 FL=1